MNTLSLDIAALDPAVALDIATAIEAVLNARTHKHSNVLGEDVLVQGTLSKALKLPQLITSLSNRAGVKQQSAQERLADIWITLSESTRIKSLERCEIYDPGVLDWEDPRSNRRPLI